MRIATPTTLLAAVALACAAPLAAQSTGPRHEGYDPNAVVGGHFHEGELGEKLLLVERAIKCQCSCGLDVHSCQYQMQCSYSPGWSERIRRELEAGRDVEAIQAGFVADFGTQVLMAPPAEGFNLVGYLLPAFAIVTAGMLVGLVARGGARRPALSPVGSVSDDDEERLREELRRLEEAESPDW